MKTGHQLACPCKISLLKDLAVDALEGMEGSRVWRKPSAGKLRIIKEPGKPTAVIKQLMYLYTMLAAWRCLRQGNNGASQAPKSLAG
jgi:hypothetical protein